MDGMSPDLSDWVRQEKWYLGETLNSDPGVPATVDHLIEFHKEHSKGVGFIGDNHLEMLSASGKGREWGITAYLTTSPDSYSINENENRLVGELTRFVARKTGRPVSDIHIDQSNALEVVADYARANGLTSRFGEEAIKSLNDLWSYKHTRDFVKAVLSRN